MASQVAQTIYQQLGAGKFTAMTGAKNLVSGGDFLQFKLPANFAKSGINFVVIRLNASDLYDIEFKKMRGLNVTDIANVRGVYADKLTAVFTEKTGLDVRL